MMSRRWKSIGKDRSLDINGSKFFVGFVRASSTTKLNASSSTEKSSGMNIVISAEDKVIPKVLAKSLKRSLLKTKFANTAFLRQKPSKLKFLLKNT